MYQQKSEWFPHNWIGETFSIANLAVDAEMKIRREKPEIEDDLIPHLVALELVVMAFDRMHELAKEHYGK